MKKLNAGKPSGYLGRLVPSALGICLLAGCATGELEESRPKTGESGTGKTAATATNSKTALTPDRVPAAVKRSFETRFPKVSAPEWKLKPAEIYEAEFTIGGAEITVQYDAAGKWLETEKGIDRAAVPKAVNASAARQFKGYKIIETQSVERWDARQLIYELHFENARQIAKVLFSGEGAVLSQSVKDKP